ncbi:MAG TPA: methyltransferase domain-containing protein [Verrucomicrobiae bacterium]|nr:methyltransferase domain-containing protein [Verrucomicrobiae bacterium]
MPGNFTTQARWDVSYRDVALQAAPLGDPVRGWLERWVPRGQGPCLELGCFPGRYLAVLGELGYELHGVDLTPRVESDLPAWLQQQAYRVGQFIKGDVFTHTFARKFEVVCSFGLIEHFGNWTELVDIHAGLVEQGGLLVLATPNFRGWVQHGLHAWLDGANLAEHNLAAMRPNQWSHQVRDAGFEILISGWFGTFDFWANADPRRSRFKRAIIKVVRRLIPMFRLLPEGVTAYAPYCGLVARKAG